MTSRCFLRACMSSTPMRFPGSIRTPTISISSSSIFPTHELLARQALHNAFYRAVARHLSAQGLWWCKARRPCCSRLLWCITQTLKQAGLQTYPYHVYVPSFGEWGFVLAGTHEYVRPNRSLPGCVSSAWMAFHVFSVSADMALSHASNQLNSRFSSALRNDWKDISH